MANYSTTRDTGGMADPLGEARARRQRRAAARIINLALFIIVGLTSLPLSAMIYIVHADYRWLQRQADIKEAQLAAFQSQYEVGKRRLAALKSEKGREEILIEHGYVPPGERILLFPATPEERRAASIPPNDLAPHPPLLPAAPPSSSEPSIWRRTANVLRGWWSALRAGAGVKPNQPETNATETNATETTTTGRSDETVSAGATSEEVGSIHVKPTTTAAEAATTTPEPGTENSLTVAP